MNIKQKLILTFLAVSLAPMLIISILFFDKAQVALQEARLAEMESIANLKVKALNKILDNLTRDVQVAQDYLNIKTNLPILTRFADDRNNAAFLKATKKLDSQFISFQKIKGLEDMMLLSPAGTVLYVANKTHTAMDFGRPLFDRIAFEQGKKAIYFGDIIKTEGKDASFEMLVTAPMRSLSGKLIGVIVFEVDMALIYDLMQDRTGLGITGETLIGKNMGDHALFLSPVLYDSDATLKRKAMFGNPYAYPIQEAVQGRNSSGVSLDYRGEEILAIWRYIPSMDWGIVAKLNTSEAFEPVIALKNIVLVIGIVILMIMVFIAIFIARSFSSPIQVLKDGIALVGAGNLDHRVSTDRKDEIGQLSRAFDEMAGNLKSATASREDFEKEIAERKQVEEEMEKKNCEIAIRNRYESSYARVVSLFSESLDQDEMLTGTLDVLAEKHPFPASAIYIYDEWSGQLKRSVDHGINSTLPQSFELGEGIIGQVLRDGKLKTLDEMAGARILSIDTGLLSFAPAAVMVAPIYFQDRSLAVLVLACSKPLIELDHQFVERLTRQLGIAMNNVTQHQALTDLAAQLQTRSDEIKHKNVQLEQASRMKSEFLANMSHELRTPLNAIIGFSEVLKDGIIGELDQEQVEYVSDIFSSGKHLLSLINDILDLSKIEAGKMDLDIDLVNISDMLRNSVSIIKEKAASHNIQVGGDFGEDLGTCYMDGRKVKQVIYNLLSNAVKFTPGAGQVRFGVRRISAEAVQADQTTTAVTPLGELMPDMEYMEIRVSDNGIGISEEDKKRLFKPFQQLESTLTKTYEGTGLGLVMVRRLAELHGGTVGMESIVGEGSTFVVWLPYHESEAQAEEIAARMKGVGEVRQDVVGLVKNVLIVEDDEKAANLMQLQLEDAGYTTRHAVSAELALEMLSEAQPDLITLDIMLPGMDGWALMQQLKRRQEMAHIPIVVVSMVADSDKGFSLGAADVLQKPVERQMLLGAIGRLDISMDGKQVLVVDDDPKAVDLLSRHLSTIGCNVLKAYGGKEAIDIASEQRPDLIILDLMMPKVSGFDVVESLRKVPELAETPVMILTAKVISAEDRKRLNRDIVKIMQKSSFHQGNFINEVNRASHSST
jgi:signal transduction histidine kinase/CheY-like chemotaxis protein/HAMP domain-containing protein